MKYIKTTFIWWTDFGTKDISFGIHICWKGRLDIHILHGMLSLGNVPIYMDREGKEFAVSNSFHKTGKRPFRAGVPS